MRFVIMVFIVVIAGISQADARCEETNSEVGCGQFSPGMKHQKFLNLEYSKDSNGVVSSPIYLYRFCAYGNNVQISISNKTPDTITINAGNCSDIDVRPSKNLEITAVAESTPATIQYNLVNVTP